MAASLDDFITAAAVALELPLEQASLEAVKANLEISLKLGNMVAEFALPDAAEPAPIFKA
jgi:1-carboxybiuret hydrolase subunit AtzG-like protein